MPTPAAKPNRAATAGTLCLVGALVGAAWGVLNAVVPNSTGTTELGTFVVLHPWLHRVEHLSAALFVFPAVFAGMLGFVAAGVAGRGLFARGVVGLAAAALLAASGSSLAEAVLLQWDAADAARGIALLVLVLLAPLLLAAAALVARTAPLGLRLAPLGLAVALIATGVAGSWLGRAEPLGVAVLMLAWAAFGRAVSRAALRTPSPAAAEDAASAAVASPAA